MPQLILYKREGCPYCQKVLNFMQQNKIQLEQRDIEQNDQDRQTLIRFGGKQQVPCLVIDGKALYESDDIIAWLGVNRKT